MKDQARYDPLEPSTFFDNGTSARHLVEGTVPVGTVEAVRLRRAGAEPVPWSRRDPLEVLAFGQERYNIWCAPCHGAAGYGDGMVARRGYPAPPSYHLPRLREAPDAHFISVMTNGWGKMPAYGRHIQDEGAKRAIVAYIRALQLSQHAPLEALPAEDRAQLQASAPTRRGAAP